MIKIKIKNLIILDLEEKEEDKIIKILINHKEKKLKK
jgi:hypothetical protein